MIASPPGMVVLAQVSGVSQDASSMDAVSVSDSVQRLPLEQLRLPPNIPAGFSPLRLYAIADHLRNTGGDVHDPVQVRRLGPEEWLVVEGRHRVLASWIAGVRDVLCVEVD